MDKCCNCRYFLREVSKDVGIIFTSMRYLCTYRNEFVPEDDHCSLFEGLPPRDSSTGFCYLTSACVDYFGKPDNCFELKTLRKFRDEYMKKTTEGCKLVKEYYEIAPKIVIAINGSSDKDKYYHYIYDIITQCVEFILHGRNIEAQNEYINMTKTLSAELL